MDADDAASRDSEPSTTSSSTSIAQCVERDESGLQDVICDNVGDNDCSKVVDDVVTNTIYKLDLDLWEKNISVCMQNYLIKKDAKGCRHADSDFIQSKRSYTVDVNMYHRFCTLSMFARVYSLTGKKWNRNRLCYSPANWNVYFFKCKRQHVTVKSEFVHGSKCLEKCNTRDRVTLTFKRTLIGFCKFFSAKNNVWSH